MTVGEYLRKIREEKKITLEQVAEGTNIRILYLEAIEDDRLDVLPSLSQAKGFTRLYAAFLGLDPLKVFEEVEKSNRPVVNPDVITEIKRQESETSDAEPILDAPSSVAAKPVRWPGSRVSSTQNSKVILQKPRSQLIFEEIGIELQRQREVLGLSPADIERQTRIREYFIYSLENGLIDALPSTVQGRGMLNNYASFLSLDAESLQMRYAEGLQLRREERQAIVEESRKTGAPVVGKEPLTGWRRFLTPDLLVGGSVFVVLFGLIIWGAVQVIRTSSLTAQPTSSIVSEVLTEQATPSPVASQETQSVGVVDQTGTPQVLNTPLVDLQATLTSISSGPIQLVVVAYQRVYMKITVDGQDAFSGRVIPGNVYTYSGKTKITLLTGNGAGLQVYYNQQDQGILGFQGEVVELEFTPKEMVTPTPRFTATPTRTEQPTLTALPTQTLPPTPTVPTATITPARTILP